MVKTESPAVVVLDVLMPEDDGWQILQYFKALPEESAIPPVIICSVLSQPALALALGAEKVLTKPIDEEVLVCAVQELLNR